VPNYPPKREAETEKELVGFLLSDLPLKQLSGRCGCSPRIGLASLRSRPKARVSVVGGWWLNCGP